MKILITLKDGRVFSVLASKVAHDMATYLAKTGGYQEEYARVMSDTYGLRNWLINYINWWELEPVLESSPEFEDFNNAEVTKTEVKR